MKVGDYPFTVQAPVSDWLSVPVLVSREVHGLDKSLCVILCGDSTQATKVVSVKQSQRRQEELSEQEQVGHERVKGH